MMNSNRWQQTAEISLRYGVIKKPAEPSAYDNQFVEKALDSLKDVDTKGLEWKPRTVRLQGRGR